MKLKPSRKSSEPTGLEVQILKENTLGLIIMVKFLGLADFHHSTSHSVFASKLQEFVLPGEGKYLFETDVQL